MSDRRPHRARSALLVALGCLMVSTQPASGLLAQETPPGDNFAHPPGTVTAPLGKPGRVDERGHGPVPVVLLPGAAFGGGIWEPFMDRNADRYTLYAVTPPGYAGTPPPPMPEQADDFTRHEWTDALLDAVVDLVRTESLERPLVIGHHLMGDHYALRLALEHPELFRGVVVIAGVPNRGAADATVAEQIQAVETQWKPFFRTVTHERWLQGTYKADNLSRDPERGRRLAAQQDAVPLPTQLRYFLEYLTTNVSLELDRLRVPLLVIGQRVDFEAQMQAWAESSVERAGSLAAAREQLEQALTAQYGSLEAAETAVTRPWERLRNRVPDLTLEYVDDTAVFIMDDQPEAVDRLLEEFVARL